MPLELATVPAPHSEASVDPAKQKWPGGHAWHSACDARPVALPKLPEAHGRGVEAPTTHCEPSGHSKHDVAPLRFMKVPAAQSTQAPWLVLGCAVPGRHAAGSCAASGHEWPTGQVLQLACDWRAVALPKLPSSQGAALALTLPSSQ